MSLLFPSRAQRRWLPSGLLTLCLALLISSPARADALPDAEGEPHVAVTALNPDNGAIAVLGVFLDDKPEKTLCKVVADRLSRLGEDVKLSEDSTELKACKQAACYAEVAQRSAASRVMRMDIYENASRRYYLEGVLYSSAKGVPRTLSGSCDDCSSENLRAMLSDLAARLVAPESTSPPPKLDPGEAVRPPPPQPAPLIDKPRRWTPGRVAVVTLLSAVTGAALVGTIALGALHPARGGNDPGFCLGDRLVPQQPGDNQHCFGQGEQIATGTILTGLAAASLGINLYLILHPSTPQRVEVAQARSVSHE